jgi:hypothetical protein
MKLDLPETVQSTKHLPKSPQTQLPPLASTIVIEARTVDSSIQTTTMDNIEPESPIKKLPTDPWVPISDEVDTALENVLNQIDLSTDTPLEFTPTTVRRTETEFMAALLPKIPLKQGRFRHGKPISSSSTITTTSNAANEYRPLAAVLPSPPE